MERNTGRTTRRRPARETGDRVARGTLSRAQVIEAAIDMVRSGDYHEMTLRSLAERLGVGTMSLYRHVRDKDDILDEVADRLLEAVWRPRLNPSNWRAWLSNAAERLRNLLVSEPAALHVYLHHPVVSPAAIARMEAMLEVLRGAGLDEGGARRAYAAVHTYTVGFAALQASRQGWVVPEEGVSSALARQLAGYTTSRQFAEGLGYLLEGFQRQA